MKRIVVLWSCFAIMLMSSAGCAKWKQKHLYRSAYVEGDACGCGSAAGPIVGAPAAFDTVVPAPSGQILSAPMKGPLPTGQF